MGKKRPNGDGSYYFLADRKVWVYAASIGGKRVKRSADTRKAARARWDGARADAEAKAVQTHPRARPDERVTVQDWLEYWYQVHSPNVRHATRVGYRGVIDLHFAPRIGHRPLVEITAHELQGLQTDLLSSLSASSVRQIRTVLRQTFDLASQQGAVASNPLSAVRGPKKPASEIDSLRLDEAKQVIAAADGPRDRARWLIALTLGLRQGECLGLRWSDLDLDGTPPMLNVAGTLQRQAGSLVHVPPKTKRSRRALELPLPVAESLREWRQLQLRLNPGAEYVFTTPNGTPIDPSNDRKN